MQRAESGATRFGDALARMLQHASPDDGPLTDESRSNGHNDEGAIEEGADREGPEEDEVTCDLLNVMLWGMWMR